MELLTASQAQTITEPYHEAWAQAHFDAWHLWQDRLQRDPEFTKPLTSSDRASILHRHITENAARALEGRVVVTERLGFFAMILQEGPVLVRFKHLDRELKPRRIPTEQQESLSAQTFSPGMMSQLNLDGVVRPPTVLTVGYVLSIGEDELSRVVVVCHAPELVFNYAISGERIVSELVSLPGFRPEGPRVVSKSEVTTATASRSED